MKTGLGMLALIGAMLVPAATALAGAVDLSPRPPARPAAATIEVSPETPAAK